ncbi:MAG: carboxypeptidase-like regulatory domain-containing protein, partial [Chitinophaga rupis]
MKQKLLLIIFFACISSMAAFAQSVQVSGRVTTSGNVPLPGTNIAVKGTSQGVISDDDGKFSI